MLRALRREGYNQKEILYLSNSIVLPNMSYGFAVYGAAEAELTTIQRFWIDIRSVGTSRIALISTIFLKNIYKKIRTKVMGLEDHTLYDMLPEVKNTSLYHLGRKSTVKL